jgi:hypothetical protein
MSTMDAWRTHVVEGEQEQVGSALARAASEGRLVRVSGVEELPEQTVRLVAQLRDQDLRGARRRRTWLVAGAVVAGTTAVAGVVWLVVEVVLAVIEFVHAVVAWGGAHLLGIGVVAVLLLVHVVRRASGSSCSGLHCGGCRR